jgi:hypothetical protein
MPDNKTLTAAALVTGAALLATLTVPVTAQRAPAPQPTRLAPEVLALACAPTMVFDAPPRPLRITGGQDTVVRASFAPGDLVTVNAGIENGIEVGQEYFVRRVQPAERRPVSRENPATIRTAGWIRIYAVDDKLSLATVTYACDSIETGDYLEPLVLPQPTPAVITNVAAQRSNYGRVLVGADGRRAFGRNDYFIVDRGSDHGVTLGAQFVIYRDKQQAENFLFELGEAVAVEVRPETSTLLVTLSRDAFLEGDYVALRK